jgi:hypothetical protein
LNKDPIAAVSEEWDKQKVDSPKLSLAMAQSMMYGYATSAELAGPFTSQGKFKLVDVEQRFEIPLRDLKLSFQCDRVVYDKEQDWLVIVDSKTAGRLDSRWDRQWETSLQMKLYRAGIKQVFAATGRIDVVVEGVLKDIPPIIRYYVCPEWSDGLLAEAGHNAYTLAALDQDIIQQGSDEMKIMDSDGVLASSQLVPNEQKIEEIALRFTPVNYMDCYSYGVECPFRKLCVSDIELRAPLLRAEYFEVEGEY